jgi:RNA polymerase sigma factor (TIGR02999 family)
LLRDTADPISRARLFALLESELRSIARSIGHKEVGHTLQPTALVNEAWMRLFGRRPRSWQDKAHFLRSASLTMRNILVDHQRRRLKHPHVEYLDGMVQALERSSGSSLLVLEDALEALAAAHPLYAQYVNLRFYGGCTNDEAANVLTISPRTGHRVWGFARTWLRRRMQP